MTSNLKTPPLSSSLEITGGIALFALLSSDFFFFWVLLFWFVFCMYVISCKALGWDFCVWAGWMLLYWGCHVWNECGPSTSFCLALFKLYVFNFVLLLLLLLIFDLFFLAPLYILWIKPINACDPDSSSVRKSQLLPCMWCVGGACPQVQPNGMMLGISYQWPSPMDCYIRWPWKLVRMVQISRTLWKCLINKRISWAKPWARG